MCCALFYFLRNGGTWKRRKKRRVEKNGLTCILEENSLLHFQCFLKLWFFKFKVIGENNQGFTKPSFFGS
jgi:hypothetical protein